MSPNETQAIATANPDKEVFIRADALVPYEKLSIMAACTQAELQPGMVTEPGVNEQKQVRRWGGIQC